MINPLETDIKYLKGVGPMRAKVLGEDLGVFTLRDMLYNFPYKYIDRSVIHRVADIIDGMPYVLLKGQIVNKNIEGTGHRERLVATFTDGSGYIELVWFNSIKMWNNRLLYNHTYVLLGKPNNFNGRYNIPHPELEDAQTTQQQPLTMQPHYHTSERMKRMGIASRQMADMVENAFKLLEGHVISEVLPDYLLRRYNLMSLDEALHKVHHPQTSKELPEATRRLKFEELFFLQLDILRYTQNRKMNYAGFVFKRVGSHFMQFYNERLPFELTNAQKRVVREIRSDVVTGKQMNRLLQGDVGSGKTMVALLSCLLALDNGFQACIMAPTEILAEQHLQSVTEYLGNLPIKVELLTGMVKGKKRKEVLAGIADGSIHILIGTHALIEPKVMFHNLGLVVIDEQHRFGVKQRAQLWKKNVCPPHILVMTATPIPRTLAMTVYGDLDVSVIDELPPGRKPIQTVHYRQTDRGRLFQGIRYQLQLGRQVYVVYPLIKENEKLDLQDLQTGYNQLVDIFKEYRVGMVHGKMKSAEKESAMAAFKSGETQILVSTTVIEVGVNVPNASVMVIENAERFGLAQLHQLRGRVGRGAEQSYCILMTKDHLTETSLRRMRVMVDSTDGFVIAEEDMKLRGPGDLEGTAQSGMPFDLKIANIVKDQELLEIAREAASEMLKQDPQNALPQNAMVWQHLKLLKKSMINFSAIS
jgi:ATP-dependent DNA helicase RecG